MIPEQHSIFHLADSMDSGFCLITHHTPSRWSHPGTPITTYPMEIPYLRLWASFLHRYRAAAQETSKALVFTVSGDDQSSVSFHPGQNPSYMKHLEIVFKTMVPFHSGSDSGKDCSKAVRE